MPEVGGVGSGNVAPQSPNRAGDITPVNQQNAQVNSANTPVGQPGPLGQPTGLPAPALPPGQTILPDVLAGRDPTQFAAAEQMRARGGASAIEELLGLNRVPTILGALAAPPGNIEALRHMTPTMRRTIMRNLLDKQREKMRRLVRLLPRERDGGGGNDSGRDERDEDRESFAEEIYGKLEKLDETQLERARLELGSTVRMLGLLDELLAMQDYAISQMGTFSQG